MFYFMLSNNIGAKKEIQKKNPPRKKTEGDSRKIDSYFLIRFALNY